VQPLHEREAELLELDGLISDAESRSGRLTLIEGPPGIGKTRLLAATCERAEERGLVVLTARGGELERDFAFGIVRQLLEPPLRAAAPAEREQLMVGAARFSEPVFAGPAVEIGHLGDPSYAVLHGLYWLVANLGERKAIVLAIDDAHWADGPSLRFLEFLGRRLQGMGVLLALASRRGEPGTQSESLRRLCQEMGTRPIEPRLLSIDAVKLLVRSRLGETISDDLCAACHEVTGGNPFLLGELLIELIWTSVCQVPSTGCPRRGGRRGRSRGRRGRPGVRDARSG
jgi:predicted ATPase